MKLEDKPVPVPLRTPQIPLRNIHKYTVWAKYRGFNAK
jgi:hypothetical protein